MGSIDIAVTEQHQRAGVPQPRRDRKVQVLLESGRIAEANVLFDELLAHPDTAPLGAPRAAVLTDRAVLAWRLGRTPLALELAAEGWTELATSPGEPATATALSKLGYLLEGIGNRRGALELLRQAVDVARKCDDADLLARCLQRLGGALNFHAIDGPDAAAAGRFAEAAAALAEGLGLSTEERIHRALLGAYARSLAGLGELERAAEFAAHTSGDGMRARDRWAMAVGDWVLGTVRVQQGEPAAARELMQRAVAEAEVINDTSLRLRFSQDLAEICAELGDHAGEAAALRHSLAASRNANSTLREGLAQALEQRRIAVHAQKLAMAAQEAAARDPLTGLANRLGLERAAPEMLRHAAEQGRMPWLALIDVDWFKSVNDVAGHAAGDAALREIARLLRRETRADDLVARWAGDEFVVLLANGDDHDLHDPTSHAGLSVAERIRTAVDNHDWSVTLGGARRPTVSIGVATGASTLEALFTTADVALYQAKRLGRNRVQAA